MNAKDKQVAVEKKVDSGQTAELTRDLPVFAPDVDIYEKEDAILVRCDMPGVDDKHVEITLENDVLTLTGYQETAQPEGMTLLHRGYAQGVFQRSFSLSTDVARDKIHARIHQGVLEIGLPKAEEAKPRKITVSAGT